MSKNNITFCIKESRPMLEIFQLTLKGCLRYSQIYQQEVGLNYV